MPHDPIGIEALRVAVGTDGNLTGKIVLVLTDGRAVVGTLQSLTPPQYLEVFQIALVAMGAGRIQLVAADTIAKDLAFSGTKH